MQLYGRLNHYCSSTVTGILGVAEFLGGPVELTYFTDRKKQLRFKVQMPKRCSLKMNLNLHGSVMCLTTGIWDRTTWCQGR